jgi:two-component system, NtrC family, response regulator AtoC
MAVKSSDSTERIPPQARLPLHESLLGTSAAMVEVNELTSKLAQSTLTVLVTGESGTGKDIVARLLHKLSPRIGKPFVKVNCPALPEGILESELFGYERGAFTGAHSSKPGRFELANHGTIFLDEIADITYNVQAKLLQVLDGEPFMRIGGVRSIHSDARVIAATNVDLDEAVRQGTMREDVFFRLSEVNIHLPPLRERAEDIPLLVEHFNFNFCEKQHKEHSPLPTDMVARMCEQEWQGNIRELAARVRKYVATGNPELLIREDTDGEFPGTHPTELGAQLALDRSERAAVEAKSAQREPERKRFVPLKEARRRAVEATERALIEEALRYTLWNRRKAAKLLQISYSSLLRRIEAYNIGKAEYESE